MVPRPRREDGAHPARPVPQPDGSSLSPALPDFDPFWRAVRGRRHLGDDAQRRLWLRPLRHRLGTGPRRVPGLQPDPVPLVPLRGEPPHLRHARRVRRATGSSSGSPVCASAWSRTAGRGCRGCSTASTACYKKMPGRFDEHPSDTLRRHVWINPFHEDDMGYLVDALGADRCCSAPTSRTPRASVTRSSSSTSSPASPSRSSSRSWVATSRSCSRSGPPGDDAPPLVVGRERSMSTGSLRGAAAIVGVADAASPTGELDTRGRVLEAAMIREALADAGLTLADVDGVCCSASRPGSPSTSTSTRGSSTAPSSAGRASSCTSSTRRPRSPPGSARWWSACTRRRPRQDRRLGTSARGVRPDGPRRRRASGSARTGRGCPMTRYALAASRHMAQYGTTAEQLAQIAVDTRRWAAMNPRARYRDPITVDDVLASPMVASPLHQLDCCLVTDGAGAYVLTSAERARDLARPAGVRARRGERARATGSSPRCPT